MPTSNFKLFDENKANMLSDSEYNSNAQRLNGVQSGVASSQLQNKFQYQASLMAYAIAQLMVQNGYDATDTTAVTTFISNLSNTMLQKVADKANETQAKVGTDNTKWMTPALVKSAINELAPMVPSILSNETKALYGLDDSATPDDVFSWIGKYAEYWWKRRVHTRTWEVSETTNGNNITVVSGSKVQYSTQVKVDFDGKLSLVNPQESVAAAYANRNDFNVAIENYWQYGTFTDRTNFWHGGNPVGNWSSDNASSFTNLTQVITTMIAENIGDWEIIRSTNRNQYPDSGNKDGYDYEYLGVPFEHSILPPVELIIGTYIGDGTSLRTINLGFTPKAIYIADPRGASFRYSSGVGRFCGGLALNGYAAIDSNRTIIKIVENGFVVNKDSSTSPYVGTNYENDVYKYVAIK